MSLIGSLWKIISMIGRDTRFKSCVFQHLCHHRAIWICIRAISHVNILQKNPKGVRDLNGPDGAGKCAERTGFLHMFTYDMCFFSPKKKMISIQVFFWNLYLLNSIYLQFTVHSTRYMYSRVHVDYNRNIARCGHKQIELIEWIRPDTLKKLQTVWYDMLIYTYIYIIIYYKYYIYKLYKDKK